MRRDDGRSSEPEPNLIRLASCASGGAPPRSSFRSFRHHRRRAQRRGAQYSTPPWALRCPLLGRRAAPHGPSPASRGGEIASADLGAICGGCGRAGLSHSLGAAAFCASSHTPTLLLQLLLGFVIAGWPPWRRWTLGSPAPPRLSRLSHPERAAACPARSSPRAPPSSAAMAAHSLPSLAGSLLRHRTTLNASLTRMLPSTRRRKSWSSSCPSAALQIRRRRQLRHPRENGGGGQLTTGLAHDSAIPPTTSWGRSRCSGARVRADATPLVLVSTAEARGDARENRD